MRKTVVIVLRHSLELCKSGSSEVPKEVLVLPKGEIRVEDAPPFFMDDQAARDVLAEFGTTGHDMVFDYEHQTMGGGEAPAAGWITALTWRPEGDKPGLYATVDWTERAAGLISKKEYRYHSPVLISDQATRRVKRLHNVALTNQPRMLDAPALAAKYTLQIEGEDEMDPKKLRELLGLDAAADESVVLKAITDLKTGKATVEAELVQLKATGGETVVACKEVLTALGLPEGADKAKVLGAVEILKAPAQASAEMTREIQALKSQVSGMAADGLVQEALSSGRTSKAELDAWGRKMATESPELFKSVVMSRAEGSVVPLKDIKTVASPASGVGVLTDEQRKINEQMGITDETWLKHNPKDATTA